MPLEPNPVAVALIEFARRGAVGAVSVGGLTLTFDRARKVVDVRGGDSLVEFLVRAALLTPPDARAFGDREDDVTLLALREKLGGASLRRARRAAWIDRIVNALGESLRPVPTPLGPVTRSLPGEPFVPLLLDALTRRAGHRDAGIIGAHADLHFVWADIDGSDLSEARRWLTYDPDANAPISKLLVGHPGAAPRLAALVRAGFGELISSDEARKASRPALPDLGRSSLAPARPPVRQLTPGATVPPPRPDAVALPEFGAQTQAPLDDPLFALESRITFLEAMDAPGPDRAEAWAAAGDAWLRIHGALDEATRAYRESAAADPTDASSLLQASQLCLATGRSDLARAYAASATAVAPDALAGECGRLEARLAILDGDQATAASLLRDHVEIDPDATEVWAGLARQTDDPILQERARSIRGRLQTGPSVLELARDQAHALVESHHPEAAVFTLATAAESTDDPGVARTLRFEAAEHAESIDRADLSFPLLLEAFCRDSSLGVLYEPLAHDSEAAGEDALCAVLLERFAALSSGTDASRWYRRAAQAFQRLPSGRAWSHELLTRALELDPSSPDVLSDIVEASDRSRDANVLADALERAAVRAPDEAAVPLLERLAELAETRLGSVHRAAWAYRMVHARTNNPSASREAVRLGQKAAVRRSLLELAEEDLEAASDAQRANAARRLAAMLRDHPEHRARATALYEECLAEAPDDRSAAQALRRLHALGSDPEARFGALGAQLERATGTSDRLRLLEELTGLGSCLGKWQRVLDQTRDWLDIAPGDRIAVARFTLASMIAGSPDDRHAARRARLRLPTIRTHAPLLVQEGLATSDAAEQLELFDRALAVDERCATAHLQRAKLELGSTAEQWKRADAALRVLPTHPELLTRAIELATTEAPERLNSLRPPASASERSRPPDERFESAAERGDAEAAERALDLWLASDPKPDGARLVAVASAFASSNIDVAMRLLVRATDQTGDPRFLKSALMLSRQHQSSEESEALLLERQVIWDDVVTPHLHALAMLRKASPAKVARTLVRIIAEDPTDRDAMDRLSRIYASSGEFERLYAVFALQRQNASNPREREHASVAMATLAYRHLSEPARGKAVLADLATSAESAALSANVLSALGDAQGAVELLMNAAEEQRGAEAAKLAVAAVTIAETQQSRESALALADRALRAGVRGADLLLTFERLSLDSRAGEQAVALYDHLRAVAMGPHGRRGTTYRKARWLERFGDEDRALEAYTEAFQESPGDGVILASIERIARRRRKLEVFASALSALSERSSGETRMRQTMRLVALYEEDCGDPNAAFDTLADYWEASQKAELVDHLRRLARALPESEREAALQRIIAGLRHRIAETWNSDDQAATLGTLALVHLADRTDQAAAELTAQELRALLSDEPDVPRRLGADAFAELARAVQDTHPSLAHDYAAEALGFDEAHELAMQVRDRNAESATDTDAEPESAVHDERSAEEEAPPAEALATPAVTATSAVAEAPSDAPRLTASDPPPDVLDDPFADVPESVRPTEPDDAPAAETSEASFADLVDTAPETPVDAEAGAPAEADVVAANDATANTRATSRRNYGRTEGGDASSAATKADNRRKTSPLAERYARGESIPGEEALRESHRSGDVHASVRLADAVGETKGRAGEAVAILLAALRRAPWVSGLYERLAFHAERANLVAPLRVADEVQAMLAGAPPPPDVDEWRRSSRLASRKELIRGEENTFLRALGLLWSEAPSLFATTYEALGVVGTERITPLTYGPLGHAAAHAPADLPLFRTSDPGVRLVATTPPSLLIGPREDSAALAFEVTACAAQCDAQTLLLCAYEERADELIEATYAAFGPAEAAQHVSSKAATLMADLWRTIPAQRQTLLRELVASSGSPSMAALRYECDARGVRAAYLSDGRLDRSLRHVGVDLDQFDASVRDSGKACAILRFALSTELLAARTDD